VFSIHGGKGRRDEFNRRWLKVILFVLVAVPNVTSLQRVSTTKKKGLIGLTFLCMTIPLMLVAQAAQPAEKRR